MTNAELIKALRYCKYGSCKDCSRNGTMDCDINLYSDAADALEAAEKRIAELMPKEGEWIHLEGDDPWEWRCTACYKIAEGHGDFRFCPYCGAKMRKGEQE